MESAPLLIEMMPELATEVRELAERSGDPGLAEQVATLRIFDRCRCGDSFCATIYTQPKPAGSWGPHHKCLPLDANAGMIVLDLVAGRIACVEVLHRDEIRARLLEVMP